jgi:BRCA1-associated protein
VGLHPLSTELQDTESDGVTLAVLAVPSWMTPSDFLGFVAPAVDGMAHLRIIRSVRCSICSQYDK